MRKHRVAVMIMAILMSVVLMDSCGKFSMAGTWEVTKVKDSGVYYDLKQYGALIGEDLEIELSLKKDGEFVLRSSNGYDSGTMEGTWEYDKPALTLDFDRKEMNDVLNSTLTYDDGELIWGNPNNDNLMFFEKK